MRVFKVLVFLLILPLWSLPVAQSVQDSITLPLPLYYIGQGQTVYRLETDGTTVRPVTPAGMLVLSYDVSPLDSRLVLVADNDLIIADPYGYDATILLSSPDNEDASTSSDWMMNEQITAPLWSADGSSIAFVQGGIQIITPSGGEPEMLLPHNERIYSPLEWSPDGTQLLLRYFTLDGARGDVILNIADRTVLELRDDYGNPFCCGDTHWSLDGNLLIHSRSGGGSSGLWFIDAPTGISQELTSRLSGNADSMIVDVKQAQQLDDGRLYYFMALRNPNTGGTTDMSMYAIDAEGQVEYFREIGIDPNNALWAPDGSGAVIPGQPLAWWPANETTPYQLAENGSALRWGR